MKYKAKENFELKEIADDYVLVPRGETSIDYGSIIVFNETGIFMWKKLCDYVTKDELASALCEKYSIDIETAEKDTAAFIEKMTESKLLDIIDE